MGIFSSFKKQAKSARPSSQEDEIGRRSGLMGGIASGLKQPPIVTPIHGDGQRAGVIGKLVSAARAGRPIGEVDEEVGGFLSDVKKRTAKIKKNNK